MRRGRSGRRGGGPGLRLAARRQRAERGRRRAAPLPRRPGDGDRVPRSQDRARVAPGGGPGRQPHAGLRAAGPRAGAQRAQRPMPFWDRDRWRPIQEFYAGSSRAGLKRCIEAVVEAEYDDFEAWDHASLREWMSRYTSDEGVFLVWEAISMLEQITARWWEHSASENLFARKLHYTARRTAGYSFWPMGGWGRLWEQMAGALRARGAVIRQPETVARVLVERGRVAGVELEAPPGGAEPEVI